jgi:uncharacterized protein (TIGR03118 family)
MKRNTNKNAINGFHISPRLSLLGLAAALAMVSVSVLADDDEFKTFTQTNLVSDLPGVAQLQDPALTNAWGVSFSSSSPFWISDNGSGVSTLYSVTNDSSGSPHVAKVSLTVTIPGDGFPTGQTFNNTKAFHTNAFIFAGENGFISGWRGSLGTTAELLVDRSATAVYKGITLDTNTGEPLLVLANFREATVDVYDTNFVLTQFQDMNAPTNYAPFNVLQIGGGLIVVTFAKQNDEKHDDVAGKGHGLIDIFDLKTGKFHRFVTGSDAGGHFKDINSPWGITVAPKGFASRDEDLLVGNFGDGTIVAFDYDGHSDGLLKGTNHHAITIDGLWALTFGNGGRAGVTNALYFTAGPNGEADGLFGSLTPTPKKNGNHQGDQGDQNNQGNGHGNH